MVSEDEEGFASMTPEAQRKGGTKGLIVKILLRVATRSATSEIFPRDIFNRSLPFFFLPQKLGLILTNKFPSHLN